MKKGFLFIVLCVITSNLFAQGNDATIVSKAESGDKVAQYNLAQYYFHGSNGYDLDYQKAFSWYKKSAEQGYSEAQVMVGFCYWEGKGVPKSYFSAFAWYKKSADQGNKIGQYNLAICYANGCGIEKNATLAAEWFKKSADKRYADAEYQIGLCLLNGNGIKKDSIAAFEYLSNASEHGKANALEELRRIANEVTNMQYAASYFLAEYYNHKDNYNEAQRYYKLSIQKGCVLAMADLGFMYHKIDSKPGSIRTTAPEREGLEGRFSYNKPETKLSERTSADSAPYWWERYMSEVGEDAQYYLVLLYRLGNSYARGEGVPVDYNKALYWFERYMNAKPSPDYMVAADPEYDEMFYADLYYFSGKDYKKALSIYESAYTYLADKNRDYGGYMEADPGWPMVGLGRLYYYGKGVPQCYDKAVKYFEEAAQNEDPEGMRFLSECYRYGRGKTRSPKLAEEWLKKAENGRDPQALRIQQITNSGL